MSEEHGVYLTLEQELNVLNLLQAVTDDPAASYWLKRAVVELWERDVVDALTIWRHYGKCWKPSIKPMY